MSSPQTFSLKRLLTTHIFRPLASHLLKKRLGNAGKKFHASLNAVSTPNRNLSESKSNQGRNQVVSNSEGESLPLGHNSINLNLKLEHTETLRSTNSDKLNADGATSAIPPGMAVWPGAVGLVQYLNKN